MNILAHPHPLETDSLFSQHKESTFFATVYNSILLAYEVLILIVSPTDAHVDSTTFLLDHLYISVTLGN